MNNLLLSFVMVLVAYNMLFAQEELGAKIEFDYTTYDYGMVKQGSDGVCKFYFTNTGNVPLIIESAKGNCGCFAPAFPKEPILPGERNFIRGSYDTDRLGSNTSYITLQTNDSDLDNGYIRLKITINVVP